VTFFRAPEPPLPPVVLLPLLSSELEQALAVTSTVASSVAASTRVPLNIPCLLKSARVGSRS
jgi:hypothetical protein